jgi:DNA-binding SARP family transcriptional activator
MLRLRLLGPPEVVRDDTPVRFDTRKAVALLAVLAVENRPMPRDRLAALLWPDADATRARSALRRTLSVTATGAGTALVADRATIGLDRTQTTVDVWEFEAAAAETEFSALAVAAATYQDDFLSGFRLRDAPAFDDWQDAVTDAFRRRLAELLARLVQASAAGHDLEAATAYAERWLRLDPLHEPAHQALIRLHAWRGDRSSAMRQYRRCLRTLDEELGVPPLAETTGLYDAVRRNELPDPPATPAQPAPEPRAPVGPMLVGRDEALASVGRVLDDLRAGNGGVAIVSGTAGMGKTALLARVVDSAGPPLRCVSVRCHPEESVLAYGVAIEALHAVAVQRPEAVGALSNHTRAELARLLPELSTLDAAPTTASDAAPAARLFAAVQDLVVAAGPMAVVIDDAQWLDGASADLFAYLVRRIRQTPLVIVTAWAEDADTGQLFRAAMDAVLEGSGTRQRLTPLTAADIATVAAAEGLDHLDPAAVLRDTGGLPALVTAYFGAVRAGKDPAARAAGLHAALEPRLANLSETTQQVLSAAAVAGGRVDPDVLRETSGRTDGELVAAVEEALRAGLLVELEGGAGYDLSVEPLRAVVLDRLTTARRRLLHRRAAAAVERRRGTRITPADAATIARHLHGAGDDDEAARWYWRAATTAAALNAREEALAQVRAALALGHAPATGRLLEGELLVGLGRYREAIDAIELAASAQGTATELAEVERVLADIHHRLGEYAIADGHVANALTLLDAPDQDVEVAQLLAERAVLAHRRGNGSAANRYAEDARAAADRAGSAGAAAYVENVRGILAAAAADRAAAERSFRQSLLAAERADDGSLAVAALNNLARLLHEDGRVDEALAAAYDALVRGERFGDLHRMAALHANLADLLRAAGREDDAMAELKAAAALFADVDDPAQRRPEIWTLVEW